MSSKAKRSTSEKTAELRKQNAQALFPDVPCDSADEIAILENCIKLMGILTNQMQEWIEDNEIEADTPFCTGFSMFEIVQRLLLFGTGHSGGRSTMKKCTELGVSPNKMVYFGSEEEDDG